MKRIKRMLEGGAVALMSWVLVASLVLSVPVQAQASDPPLPTYTDLPPQPSGLPEQAAGWPRYAIAAALAIWFKYPGCTGLPAALSFSLPVFMRRIFSGPVRGSHTSNRYAYYRDAFAKERAEGFRSVRVWGLCWDLDIDPSWDGPVYDGGG